MAVVTKYGTGYKDPNSQRLVEAIFAEATVKAINSEIKISNGDSAGSKYIVGRLPSDAIIDPFSTYQHTALTGVVDLDIGFAGGVIAADAADNLVDGDDVALAGSQTFAGHGTLTTENSNKRVWELAGLVANPGGMIDLVATINAAATADGSINFIVRFAKQG